MGYHKKELIVHCGILALMYVRFPRQNRLEARYKCPVVYSPIPPRLSQVPPRPGSGAPGGLWRDRVLGQPPLLSSQHWYAENRSSWGAPAASMSLIVTPGIQV